MDHDGHFVDNIADESVNVEKIVETQMMIETVRSAISRLNAEERDIIERLYFNDETVRSVAKLKNITHPALIKRFSLCKVKGSLASFTFSGKRYACLWQIGKCKENNPFQNIAL